MTESAISVRGLRKSYGEHEAVRGIDFDVAAGEVFGFLGPNGAGKTTTIEILEGYRERSGGEVSVLGVDPGAPTRAWRNRVGLVLQECELDPLWTVREAVGLFARFYERPRPVEETIELVGLADKRDARVGTLSGGQKRRELSACCARTGKAFNHSKAAMMKAKRMWSPWWRACVTLNTGPPIDFATPLKSVLDSASAIVRLAAGIAPFQLSILSQGAK